MVPKRLQPTLWAWSCRSLTSIPRPGRRSSKRSDSATDGFQGGGRGFPHTLATCSLARRSDCTCVVNHILTSIVYNNDDSGPRQHTNFTKTTKTTNTDYAKKTDNAKNTKNTNNANSKDTDDDGNDTGNDDTNTTEREMHMWGLWAWSKADMRRGRHCRSTLAMPLSGTSVASFAAHTLSGRGAVRDTTEAAETAARPAGDERCEAPDAHATTLRVASWRQECLRHPGDHTHDHNSGDNAHEDSADRWSRTLTREAVWEGRGVRTVRPGAQG